MRNKLFLLLSITIMLLTACQQKDETYKLGFIGTLSGEYAEVGLAAMRGAQLAIEEINEAGGVNGSIIELIVRDDEANPNTAVEMQNELYDIGIDIVIGHSLSIVAIEAVANANEKGMLLLSPSIGTDALSNIDDNLVRTVATVRNESQFVTSKIIENEPNKVLMIYNTDNLVLTQYHKEAFIETMLANDYSETEYLTVPFESGNTVEIHTVESHLSSGEYDTAFIASSNTDASGFVNYVTVNNLDIELHLTSWASTGLLENIDLTKTDNIYGYINFDSYNNSPNFVSFKQKYMDTYDKEINMLSVNGYDIVYIFKNAAEKVDSFDYTLIKEAIIDIGEFNGINSTFEINEFGDCEREHVQLIIEQGVFVKND